MGHGGGLPSCRSGSRQEHPSDPDRKAHHVQPPEKSGTPGIKYPVIGGSGSGKTRFFVALLMQMHSSLSVVTDPKGQLCPRWGLCCGGAPKLDENGKVMRDSRGKVIYEPYRIKVLNTINFKKSMKYNPLRLYPVGERHPQIGQCHHCQHQRRRRKSSKIFG